MASQGEKILVVEILATEIIVTVKELGAGNVPRPSQYVASLFVFMVLGGVAAFGSGPARVAALFGGLVVVTTLVESVGGYTNPNSPANFSNLINKIVGAVTGVQPVPGQVIPFPTPATAGGTPAPPTGSGVGGGGVRNI